MDVFEWLGHPAPMLFKEEPFMNWPSTRTVDDELGRIDYVFDGHGMAMICDPDETIRTVFLYASEHGLGGHIFDAVFAMSRHEILSRFGTPCKSGEWRRDSI